MIPLWENSRQNPTVCSRELESLKIISGSNMLIPVYLQSFKRCDEHFSVKDKVTVKVNELLEKDIIENFEEPTVCVSPVVVASKLLNQTKVMCYIRRANEAIIRERLPGPTIDEVIESLNGSGVFSKLELRWGFHRSTRSGKHSRWSYRSRSRHWGTWLELTQWVATS